MMDYITLSLQRAWQIVKREKSALWTAIYAYAMSESSPHHQTSDEVSSAHPQTWRVTLI